MKEVPKEAWAQPPDAGANADGAPGSVTQFVTFKIGQEVFAIEMGPVKEIIRIPALVRVPLAPPALEGIANLRGEVLPIVSLRNILGLARQAHNDTSRALVVDCGQRIGFVVDQVSSVVGIENDRIEAVSDVKTAAGADCLSGMIRNVGPHEIVMVLDFAQLVRREFADIAEATIGPMVERSATDSVEAKAATADERQLVSFMLADEAYAIDIDRVREIVQFPAALTSLPGGPAHLLGLCLLRGRMLPVMSLRAMFGLPAIANDDKCRIVILSVGEGGVGLAVDCVSAILRVAQADLRPVPPFLGDQQDRSNIAALCQPDDGRRLVSIIDLGGLFDEALVAEIEAEMAMSEDPDMSDAATEVESKRDEQLVAFSVGEEEYGIAIASVKEIVRVPEQLFRVPQASDCVEGVLNLRGEVLPVLDLRQRLGMERIEPSDRQRIMVLLVQGARTGFIVDQVTQVLTVPCDRIEASPRLSRDHGQLIPRIVNLSAEGRMLQLIDPEYLIDSERDLAAA